MAVSLGAAKKPGAPGTSSTAKQESKGRVSLNPDTFTAGGAGLNDVNATFIKNRFVQCELQAEGEKTTVLQYFSAGDLKRFQPSEDGRQLEKVGSAETLNNNTNFNTLIKSIRDAGFPSDKLDTEDQGIGALDGLYAHVIQIPQQKRAGLEGSKDGKTVMVVDKIIKLPWENTTATGAVAKTKVATSGGGSTGGVNFGSGFSTAGVSPSMQHRQPSCGAPRPPKIPDKMTRKPPPPLPAVLRLRAPSTMSEKSKPLKSLPG